MSSLGLPTSTSVSLVFELLGSAVAVSLVKIKSLGGSFADLQDVDPRVRHDQIAKELGMSAQGLNKFLHSKHIIYKESGTWMLYAYYQSKGLTKTKTYNYYSNNGDPLTSMQIVWTEKGREFIHKIHKKHYEDCTVLV